ncbi:DDE-domain-containing protein, partial [Didymella exigua CBS 183.55]
KVIQQGNREWTTTTLIQGVSAIGRVIPPFLIFASKVLISNYLTGWTNNNLALAWLDHFDTHARPVGAYRLLIINGHKSHCLIDFQDRCKEKKIIALCMPPHSSHLLQLLDVACFSPLKRAYSDQISALARDCINHISKQTFLPAFKVAFKKAFTRENACAGF